MAKRKAFVLLSGGMDSTTCFYDAVGTYPEVEGVSFDYGQKQMRELQYARRTCERGGAKHTVLSLGDLLVGKGIPMTDADTDIPHEDYSETVGMAPTYVPFRNGTMLSVLTAYAEKWAMAQDLPLEDMIDSVGIYAGMHAGDGMDWAYADCSPEFVGAMANAIYMGTYRVVRLHTPLLHLSKADVVKKGFNLGVSWSQTWSCYDGGDVHCGLCGTCRDRKKAFKQAGIMDPTEYAN